MRSLGVGLTRSGTVVKSRPLPLDAIWDDGNAGPGSFMCAAAMRLWTSHQPTTTSQKLKTYD
jgi:hypothetical protein